MAVTFCQIAVNRWRMLWHLCKKTTKTVKFLSVCVWMQPINLLWLMSGLFAWMDDDFADFFFVCFKVYEHLIFLEIVLYIWKSFKRPADVNQQGETFTETILLSAAVFSDCTKLYFPKKPQNAFVLQNFVVKNPCLSTVSSRMLLLSVNVTCL